MNKVHPFQDVAKKGKTIKLKVTDSILRYVQFDLEAINRSLTNALEEVTLQLLVSNGIFKGNSAHSIKYKPRDEKIDIFKDKIVKRQCILRPLLAIDVEKSNKITIQGKDYVFWRC
jgi:hypothetical protein